MLALLWHGRGIGWVQGHILATASVSRPIDVLGCGAVRVVEANAEDVAAFAPTLIVNCAFPTRNRVDDLGMSDYLWLARRLTEELLDWAALPSVDRVVTLSSGASVPSDKFPRDLERNPYGVLKAEEGEALLSLAQRRGISAQVCRVWAVSGPHVQHPANYALSNFILQARDSGQILVRSSVPVIRTYAGADDVLALSLASLEAGSGLFDTGGATVEVGEVAREVATQFGQVRVSRENYDPQAQPDDYRATSADWERLCREHGLTPADLTEQVRATIAGAAAWTT